MGCLASRTRMEEVRRMSSTTSSTSCSSAGSGPPPRSYGAVLCEALQTDADVFTRAQGGACLMGSTLRKKHGASLSVATSDDDAMLEADYEAKRLVCARDGGPRELLRELEREGIAVACWHGRKDAPNQDNVIFCRAGGVTIFGVLDGHGVAGHWVSHWAARYALAAVLAELPGPQEDPPDPALDQVAFRRIFERVHDSLGERAALSGFDITGSGSTFTLCLLRERGTAARDLATAWVGDSRALLAEEHADGAIDSMTKDHKPTDIEERMRVLSNGGEIRHSRVSSRSSQAPPPRASGCCGGPLDGGPGAGGEEEEGLAITRALGDTDLHRVGVSHVPGVAHRRLPPEPGQGGFALVCSDGVWDFVEGQEAAAVVRGAGRAGAAGAVQRLLETAKERWLRHQGDAAGAGACDDLSAILVWL